MSSNKKLQNRITTFKRMNDEIVAANASAYKYPMPYGHARQHTIYTKEETQQIIQTGDAMELQQLSISFFYTSGFYKKMLLYYATLLTYSFLSSSYVEIQNTPVCIAPS